MKTKYEYRVVQFDINWKMLGTKLTTDFATIEKQMNVLGMEGWDLVKVSEVLAGTVFTVALIATFKRTAG